MRLLNFLNRTIEYSFYLILFLVPLALAGDTSELFEFNKLWVTFILTLVIAAAWISKAIVLKKVEIQRTPLDIPIALFLASQVISTVLSLDVHTSLWGYYSRFNGGLYSILAYIFIYYAFVSNYKDFGGSDKNGPLTLKRFLVFAVAIIVFFAGNWASSLFVKTQSGSLLPAQTLISLASAVFSFAIFMLAAPASGVRRVFYAILSGTVIVVLWGLPSHFGYDPTCLLFRGALDVSCWTADFQPKIRAFSTLGQPDWLGAYLVALLPLMVAILINTFKENQIVVKVNDFFKNLNFVFVALLFVFIGASYLLLLHTLSRSAVAAGWISFVLLFGYFIWAYILPKFNRKKLTVDFKLAAVLVILIGAITFVSNQPFSFLNSFTLSGITSKIQSFNTKPQANSKKVSAKPAQPPAFSTGELGGTDSGIIRKYVWQGAVEVWKHYPLFGSGVETYAYSYYRFKPVGHNLTSEWNFLYNKAHNEFLNYLATTGTFGIATYLAIIGMFLYVTIKFLQKNLKKQTTSSFIVVSLVAGYVGILITNFFGFSVVYINILFFLFPAFVFISADLLPTKNLVLFNFSKQKQVVLISNPQKGAMILTAIAIGALIFFLARFWQADRYYYYGLNLDRGQNYQTAYPYLAHAVGLRPSEPTFKDEFALNNAALALQILIQNQQKPDPQNTNTAKSLIQNAVSISDALSQEHPNDIVIAKTRVRIYYTLAQADPTYFAKALDAIKRAKVLAPTDPDISYNLGVFQGQSGDVKSAVLELERTIKLKPDYPNGNAYYALGIFYHQLAVDKNGKVIDRTNLANAIDAMKTLIKIFGPNDNAQAAIDSWSKE